MNLVPLFDLKFLTRSPQPVQEFQIGGTSVPIPKFASFCGTLVCELRIERTLAWY
jgi:hypothetical protein